MSETDDTQTKPELVRDTQQLETRRDPPIVARLVVEIRSDGSYTVARGALEDGLAGKRVSIEAEGSTPLELAASLLKTLVTLPGVKVSPRELARVVLRALNPWKKSTTNEP